MPIQDSNEAANGPALEPEENEARRPQRDVASAQKIDRQTLIDGLLWYVTYFAVCGLFLATTDVLEGFLQSLGLNLLTRVFCFGVAFTLCFTALLALAKRWMYWWRGYILVDPNGDAHSASNVLWNFDLSTRLVSSVLASCFLGLLYAFAYWMMQVIGHLWWIPITALMFAKDVLIGGAASSYIRQALLQCKPLEDGPLRAELSQVANRAGTANIEFYVIDDDHDGYCGAFVQGRKRASVCLGTALVKTFSNGEIAAIVRHELGHLKERHQMRMHLLQLLTLASTYLGAELVLRFSFPQSASYPASSLPLFLLTALCFRIIARPLTKWVQRHHELEADHYAWKSHPSEWKSALRKLSTANAENPSPHWWRVMWDYDHPPLAKRLLAPRRSQVTA